MDSSKRALLMDKTDEEKIILTRTAYGWSKNEI